MSLLIFQKIDKEISLYEFFNKMDLVDACSINSIYSVRISIKEGANINSCDIDGNSCLTYPASYGNLEILKILIENGAEDKDGASLIIAMDECFDIADYNPNIWIQMNKEGPDPKAFKKYYKVIRYLLDNNSYSNEVWNNVNKRFGDEFICKIKGYKIMNPVLTQ